MNFSMDCYSDILSGIFPSITIPFVDGRVDYGQLISNIEKYNEYNLGGYMTLGGNGEYLGLTPYETTNIVRTIVSASKPGRPIVAGTGRESAEATIEFIRHIAGMGVDIASIITPFYYAKYLKDENLIAYFEKIADESPIPIIIYNSPSYAAGVSISPDAILKLSRHENIVGMKNSSSRETSDYISLVGKDSNFSFHAGRIADFYRDYKHGAVGATLSMADYWPQDCINMYALLQQGRNDEAAEMCARIDRAGKAGASAYGVPGVKYAMDIAGFYGGESRLPLIPLSDIQKEQIKKSFALKEETKVL